jgi:acyl dehydratase
MMVIEFGKRPPVVAHQLRAFLLRPVRRGKPFPRMSARWRACRPETARLRRFLDLTGLEAPSVLPIAFPHVVTFPLQMAIVSDPSMPIPIWKVFQIRNSIVQHEPIPVDAPLDSEVRVVAERVLERGIEVDYHVVVSTAGDLKWESLTTWYYRGSFGEPDCAPPAASAPPAVDGVDVASWRTHDSGGFAFAGISGDYNVMHYSNLWARLNGFRGAFHHPHVVVGQSLSRIAPPDSQAQRLDLWFKGPIYYGTLVHLTSQRAGDDIRLAVTPAGGDRPALVGRWSAVAPGTRLVDPAAASATRAVGSTG